MNSKTKALVLLGTLAASSIGIRGAGHEHRAALSTDLLGRERGRAAARTRVIVHGDAATIDAIAERHHVQIFRRLAGGAVLSANGDEIARLSADEAIDHLSGDVPVRPSMSISNQATAADQTRAGTPGLLLGIGGIPAVTGQGIGVAVVDSGISPHAA